MNKVELQRSKVGKIYLVARLLWKIPRLSRFLLPELELLLKTM